MKWKLSLLTLLGFYALGTLVPDDRPVARVSQISVSTASSEQDPSRDFSFFSPSFADIWERNSYQSEISDAEAIEIALRRGEEIKSERETGVQKEPRETAGAAEPAPLEPAETEVEGPATDEPSEIWRVVADRVNLRGGPGTDNPVVGSATSGEELVPVSDVENDWIEIRRASGETAWIYGQFLERADG